MRLKKQEQLRIRRFLFRLVFKEYKPAEVTLKSVHAQGQSNPGKQDPHDIAAPPSIKKDKQQLLPHEEPYRYFLKGGCTALGL